jgi:hypothetical protein
MKNQKIYPNPITDSNASIFVKELKTVKLKKKSTAPDSHPNVIIESKNMRNSTKKENITVTKLF